MTDEPPHPLRPCVAAPRDERWWRTRAGFCEAPELTALPAAAAVNGLWTHPDGRSTVTALQNIGHGLKVERIFITGHFLPADFS